MKQGIWLFIAKKANPHATIENTICSELLLIRDSDRTAGYLNIVTI
jgi:hypothetical protein